MDVCANRLTRPTSSQSTKILYPRYPSPPPASFPQFPTTEPWTILRGSPGPMILMLRRSLTICTLQRRRPSQGISLAQYSSVRRALICQCLPVRSIHIQGIIITLFFQCLNALLNPVNRPGTGIKWPFVAHTIAMFSFVTVIIVMCLGVLPVCYIDNREFPGGYFPVPGPLGYYASLYSKPIDVVPKVMFLLNYCLADGLLVSAISNQPLRCLMRAAPQLYRDRKSVV